jgi:acetyl-CoA carboxylase carboxyltransferase component
VQRVAWKKCSRRESAADAHSEEQDLAGFAHQRDPRCAAARVWVEAIIDLAETRNPLISALEAAALNPERREFKTGALPT